MFKLIPPRSRFNNNYGPHNNNEESSNYDIKASIEFAQYTVNAVNNSSTCILKIIIMILIIIL